MSSRTGFWQAAKADDGSKNVQRNASTLSKQFQPKKVKEASQEWLQTDGGEHLSNGGYTPFRSSSRATTPATEDRRQHTGTLRASNNNNNKPNPFEYNPGTFKDLPQSQSTPKEQRGTLSRTGSGVPNVPTIPRATSRQEKSRTWGRGGVPPHLMPARSNSAMGASLMRPASRNSEMPIHNVGSRYQSFCTLPRPEHMDPRSLDEMAYYGDYLNRGPQPKMIISRPPSALPPSGLPIANYPGHPPVGGYLPPQANATQETLNGHGRQVIGWNSISIYSSIQVLCGLLIFGAGVYRMLQHAKWALGVELAYGIVVLITGLLGVASVRRHSAALACVVYAMSAANIVLAIVPFALGLFPALPWVFPGISEGVLTNKDEPIEVDFGLSLVVGIEVLVCILTCLSGCRSVGRLFSLVDRLQRKIDIESLNSLSLPSKH